jgi:hypothetical protein
MLPKFKLFIIGLAVLSIIFLMFCKSPTDDDKGDTPEWQTVFFDDFNRSDGSAGSNYTVQIESGSGVLSISNNMLQLSGGVYYAIRYVNEVTNDVIRVSVKCSTMTAPSDSIGFGVCVKGRILSNLQEFYIGAVWMSIDSIAVHKMSGTGLSPPLISKDYDVQENRSYLLELTINNKDLTFIVKDLITGIADTLNVKDTGSPLTGGTVSINGLQGDGDTIYFDDFKIEKYE